MDKNAEPAMRIKKSTGIPRSFMVKVDDPSIKGAMLTNTGDYAVPAIDAEVYAACKKKTPAQELPTEEPSDVPIPDELMCLICKDLLDDAVVIPCCGNSYCDDCIRSALLDSEDHVCPTCDQSDVSPDALIANKFLRQAVNNFTKEQVSAQSLRNKCSTSLSQNCTPRPSPVPTPPPPSQPDKSQVADMPAITKSDSPPRPASTSLIVVKITDETPDKEADLKTDCSPAECPSVLVSEADTCDSLSQPIPLVSSVAQAVTDKSKTGSMSQSEQTLPWDRSTSASPCEGWTAMSTAPPHATSTSFSLSPNITPSHIQMYLPLNTYPSGFTTSTPSWTSGPSPQGAPIPTCTSSSSSSSSIPPLLPKELMLYHRRKKERTPPRGSSYQSYHYSSESHRSKCSRSSSRSPSQSRSRHRSRPYSPQSSHRGLSSHSHSSHSYSYKRSHAPAPTSPPRSERRSRSPTDRHKSHRHTNRSSPSSHGSSRRKESSHRPREAPVWNLDEYLRQKQEYKDRCEKYFNSYFSQFHQMPPPPLMPPPESHRPSSSHHKGRSPPSPPSSDSLTSQSHSASSTSNSHSSSSYSDSHSTPIQSFSDSNSPLSDDCSRASQEPLKVSHRRDKDDNQNKMRESGKQNTEDYTRLKLPPKKIDTHLKSKHEDKKSKAQKQLDKEKERRKYEDNRSKQSGRSRSPDSRSDKRRKRKKTEETSVDQRQNTLIEPSSSCDPLPKVFEKEKPKRASWKPQPLTAKNAWEGSVTVKTPQKINININLDVKKTQDDAVEAKTTFKEVESHTGVNPLYTQVDKAGKPENEVERQLIPEEETRDEKNDSWESCPKDEAFGEEDSDLWHCALTAVEEEERTEKEKLKRVAEEDGKPQMPEIIPDSERKKDDNERPGTTKDNCSLTVAPSGAVTISEEQQKTVTCLEKYMDNRSLEKQRGHGKVTHSGWEKDGSEKELGLKLSSNHREVKERTKRGFVEVELADETGKSSSLDSTVVPSSGQDVTDSSLDFDRKRKKRTERESECRKGKECSQEKESSNTFYSISSKTSSGSSETFRSILDEEKSSKSRESGGNGNREDSSRKIHIDLDTRRSNSDKSSSYSRSHHNRPQDPDVHQLWSPPQSHSRDRGQQTSKTPTEGSVGQNWTCTSQRPATPTAQSSTGMALSMKKEKERLNNEKIEERERGKEKHVYADRSYSTNDSDAKNERTRGKKKQKSHKKERRHASSDEEKTTKKKNKD
ncbi:uncharacterized protein [Eucyclogobius newberryi]|uniref:uncharacterized protein n=1 Tax=Eucyclogobius newberryi TaxID=166745 RepID=UPI003B5A306B